MISGERGREDEEEVGRWAVAPLAVAMLLLPACLVGPSVTTAEEPDADRAAGGERRESESPRQPERPASVGDSIMLSGTEYGLRMRVTPLRVLDPAAPADAYLGPGKGKRFVAVEVELQNVGSVVYRDFPSNGAVLVDTRSRQYQSTLWDVKAGPALAQTTIAPGDKRVGFITFEVPRRVRPARFQLTLDSGFGPEAGEWQLR